MSVYFIASYDVVDPVALENYVNAAGPLMEKHGGELIIADETAKVIEGNSADVNVVVKFDSETAAMNFYNDPDYQPVKRIRLGATRNSNVVLVKEFDPTQA